MKLIEIVVSPTGEPQVETKGFRGSECRDASRCIEEALGKHTGEKLTGEIYAEMSVDHRHQQKT